METSGSDSAAMVAVPGGTPGNSGLTSEALSTSSSSAAPTPHLAVLNRALLRCALRLAIQIALTSCDLKFIVAS